MSTSVLLFCKFNLESEYKIQNELNVAKIHLWRQFFQQVLISDMTNYLCVYSLS